MIKKQRFLPEEYASQIDTEKFGTNGTVFRKVIVSWSGAFHPNLYNVQIPVSDLF